MQHTILLASFALATAPATAQGISQRVMNPATGRSYQLVSAPSSWSESRARAQFMQGDLASIETQAELDWIVSYIRPDRCWIGLYQDPNEPTFSEPTGGWRWVSGPLVAFSNWAPGEPNNTSATGGAEDFGEILASGTWNDVEEQHAPTTQFLVEWLPPLGGPQFCFPSVVPNSTGLPGVLTASGAPLLAINDFTLEAFQLPPNRFGVFLASPHVGFVPMPGGSQGNICLGSPLGRFNAPGQVMRTSAAGELELMLDLTQPASGLALIQEGETWNFQLWFRDVAAGASTSNFTNGFGIEFH